MEIFDKAKSSPDLAAGRRNTPLPELGFEVLGEFLPRLGICVLVFDETGRRVYSSPDLGELLGSVPSTTAELAAAITDSPDTLDRLTRGMANVRGEKDPFAMEIPGVSCADGTHTCSLAAFPWDEGDEHRLIVFLKNITLESKLREDVESLDRLASAGRAAAGAAHELNNIITAMLGWTQIAKRTSTGDERALKALDTLEQSSHRARQIASQLLTVSRPEGLPERHLFTESAVEDALSLLGWELSEADVVVSREIGTTAPIRADATRLAQLFVNLIRNAIEAMPDGGEIKVSVAQVDETVEVVLADDGTGIDPEIADRIFEPYFSTKDYHGDRETGGSGLGLAISLKIVEEHGGAIAAAANEQGGTSITVSLPVAVDADDHMSEPPTTRSSFPPGVSVLVVDDDLDIREMISTALELRGATVTTAASGDEAVGLCEEQRFDAAFVDYSMLGLSGHELGQAINEVQPHLPIVFMSGREVGSNGDAHVIDYLKKPFDLGEIQRKLRQVLDRRSGD
jgi:signal transduction histidine kinase/CheY-like chemotaxis protein